MLETLGTQNFNRAMQDALNAQKWANYRDARIAELKQFATEVSDASSEKYAYVKCWGNWGMNKNDTVAVPDDADTVEYVFKVTKSDIALYKKRDTAAEDKENALREAAREASRIAYEQFAALTKFMYELRWNFVKELTPAECKKHLPSIMAYAAPLLTGYESVDADENVLRLLGIGRDERIQENMDLDDVLKLFKAYETEPEKVLLAMAFDARDNDKNGYWESQWNTEKGSSDYVHSVNEDLDETYALLTALGYEMSDEEKALQDGSHASFAVYGPKNTTDKEDAE